MLLIREIGMENVVEFDMKDNTSDVGSYPDDRTETDNPVNMPVLKLKTGKRDLQNNKTMSFSFPKSQIKRKITDLILLTHPTHQPTHPNLYPISQCILDQAST